MSALQHRQILILGLGLSGLAMARWCTRQGAQVSVWDSRDEPPQAQALRESCPQVRLQGGTLGPEAVQGLHWLLKSPGLAPHDAQIAPVLAAAREAGIRCGSELDLFTLALAELKSATGYAPQLLAVTGTNGKTTTTALTALLVERAGRSAMAAGNIGPTLLESLAARLDAQDLPQVWVLELSSFQLADLSPQPVTEAGFDPAAAVVLNLTQDHLDWHRDMASYAAAKARIFGRQAVMVVNRDAEAPSPAPRSRPRARPSRCSAR
jgi:UDP-N-acetylmuramoylalanine--D-glutamate ligase